MLVCKSSGHLFTPEPSLQPLLYIFNMFALVYLFGTETRSYCLFTVKRPLPDQGDASKSSQTGEQAFRHKSLEELDSLSNHHIRSRCVALAGYSRCAGLVLLKLREPPASASQLPGFSAVFEDVLFVNARLLHCSADWPPMQRVLRFSRPDAGVTPLVAQGCHAGSLE